MKRLQAFFVHRMSLWLWLSVAGLVALRFAAPHMIPVVGFKIILLTVAGYLGYWISYFLERGNRPHEIMEDSAGVIAAGKLDLVWSLWRLADNLRLRRTIIVAACLIASALGG